VKIPQRFHAPASWIHVTSKVPKESDIYGFHLRALTAFVVETIFLVAARTTPAPARTF